MPQSASQNLGRQVTLRCPCRPFESAAPRELARRRPSHPRPARDAHVARENLPCIQMTFAESPICAQTW